MLLLRCFGVLQITSFSQGHVSWLADIFTKDTFVTPVSSSLFACLTSLNQKLFCLFACRFLELMSQQPWKHGGYWVVVHKVNSSIFLSILRTRPDPKLRMDWGHWPNHRLNWFNMDHWSTGSKASQSSLTESKSPTSHTRHSTVRRYSSYLENAPACMVVIILTMWTIYHFISHKKD